MTTHIPSNLVLVNARTSPDLVAYLPCPIKVPFEQAIHEYLFSQGSPEYSLQIEGNANKNEADYEALIGAKSADELPSLLITPGVNQLFGSQFLTHVLDSGQYADAASYSKDTARPEDALRDPLGYATVLAANVTLMVVDHSQLGTRPKPKRWEDLLAPDFAGAVLMRGNGKTYCETTLLAWHQMFGQAGLTQIGRSVREGCHPAQMAKVAGTGQAGGAAVYVMPYFFARNIRYQDKISLIWPDEGVIASPVTLLAKRAIAPGLRQFAEWLAGPTMARLFSRAGLPTPHPEVDSGLPAGTRYLWPGWERARSTDLSSELSSAEAAFASGHRWPVCSPGHFSRS